MNTRPRVLLKGLIAERPTAPPLGTHFIELNAEGEEIGLSVFAQPHKGGGQWIDVPMACPHCGKAITVPMGVLL